MKKFNVVRQFKNEEVEIQLLHEPERDIWGVSVLADKRKNMIGYSKRGGTLIFNKTVERYNRRYYRVGGQVVTLDDYDCHSFYINNSTGKYIKLLSCKEIEDWAIESSFYKVPHFGLSKTEAKEKFTKLFMKYEACKGEKKK